MGPFVTVVIIIVFAFILSANAGATCDIPVPISAVKIPNDSTANIKTFLVFKVCYRKLILNKV